MTEAGSSSSRDEYPWRGSRLEYWLHHDGWTAGNAALILLGVDPDSVRKDDGDDDEEPRIVRYAPFGRPPMSGERCEAFFRQLQKRVHDIVRMTTSGAHLDGASSVKSPRDWVEWASAKGVHIPWLKWAAAKGLVGDPVREASATKPLGQRERTSLLVVIAALANELGIDVRQTSKAASAIERLTEALGVRVAARTIEEHLKRIPDALERRGNQ
jgi:hypothetical protein